MNEISQIENKQNTTGIVKTESLLHYPDLTIQDVENSKISYQDKRVILASLNYPKLRDVQGIETHNNLVKLIGITIWESGASNEVGKMDEQEQELIIQNVMNDINDDFIDLTLQEVTIAFKNGVRKKYGEYYGLSVATFYHWLTCYVKETKITANKQLAFIKKEEDPLTEEYKNQTKSIWVKKITDCYELFLKDDKFTYEDYNSFFYLHCRDNVKLTLTDKEKVTIWDDAVREFKMDRHHTRAKGKIQLVDFKKEVERLHQGDRSMQIIVLAIAQKKAVKYYFMRIKEAGLDFLKIAQDAAAGIFKPKSETKPEQKFDHKQKYEQKIDPNNENSSTVPNNA